MNDRRSCHGAHGMGEKKTEKSLEDDYPDGAELVSAQARQALISLTEGEALEIVKNTSRGTHFGLEAPQTTEIV